MAVYPLAFGVQQAIEGVLWLALTASDHGQVALAARGFLFFSHLFWLAWVPFSVFCLEAQSEPWRRRALFVLAVSGLLFGLSISLPSLIRHDWLSVEIVHGSIEYNTVLIYDGVVGRTVLKVAYAAIVVCALFLSTERLVQVFGGIILASLLLVEHYFAHAFISVWCYFAAVLSIYVGFMLTVRARQVERMA